MNEEGHQSNGSEYQVEAPKEDHDEEDEEVLPSTAIFYLPFSHFLSEEILISPQIMKTGPTLCLLSQPITSTIMNAFFLICFLGGIETRPKENPFLKLFAVCCCCWIDWERSTKKEGRGRKTKYQIPKTKNQTLVKHKTTPKPIKLIPFIFH